MIGSTPGRPGYDEAVATFNLSAPARPAVAVTVRTVEDIRGALRRASTEGLGVRVHTTGHAAGATRPIRAGLLVRTQLDGAVEVDPVRRIARIPAGTCWGAVVEAIAPHGLAVAHGSAATVGAIGYLLRGGMSFYGRRVGLAVNAVRAIELVTAEGTFRRVDDASDPELFDALRGGGGGFGIVTAVEVDLFPAHEVVTGAAFWPATHAEELLAAWLDWSLDAPEEVTTSVRVMNLPAIAEPPPEFRQALFVVDGAALAATPGDVPTAHAHAADLLDRLRAIAEPIMNSWAPAQPAAVLGAHQDPDQPIPFVGDHMLLGELGERGAAEFLRATGPASGSPLVVAGLRQLGGRYPVPDPRGGVLTTLDARFSYAGSGLALDPATADALRAHCATVRAVLAPWDTGRTVPGFVEDFGQPQGHLDAAQVRFVDAVRARVDPRGIFRGDIAPNATATSGEVAAA